MDPSSIYGTATGLSNLFDYVYHTPEQRIVTTGSQHPYTNPRAPALRRRRRSPSPGDSGRRVRRRIDFSSPQGRVQAPQPTTMAVWRRGGPIRQAYTSRQRAAITKAKKIRRKYRAARSFKSALRKRITKRGQSVKGYGAAIRRGLRAGLYRKKKRSKLVASLKSHDPVLMIKRQLHWWGGYLYAHVPGDPHNPLGAQYGLLPQDAGGNASLEPKYYKHFYNRHKRFYPVMHNTVVKCCLHFKDFFKQGSTFLDNIFSYHPNLLAMARAPTAPNMDRSMFASKDGWTDNKRIRPLGMSFKVHIDTTYSANWTLKLVLVKGKHSDLNKYSAQDFADPTLPMSTYKNIWIDSEGSTYNLANPTTMDERDRLMLQSTDGLQCTSYHTTKPADFWARGGMGYRALPYKNQANMNVMKDPLDRKDFNVCATWTIRKPSSTARAVNHMNVPFANDFHATTDNPDGHQQDQVHEDPMDNDIQGDDTAAVTVYNNNYTGDDHLEINRTFHYKFNTGYEFNFDPAPHKLRGAQHERWMDDPTIQYPNTATSSNSYWQGTKDDLLTVDQNGFYKNAHGEFNDYQLYVMAYDTMAQNPTRQLFFMNIEQTLTYRNGPETVNHGM